MSTRRSIAIELANCLYQASEYANKLAQWPTDDEVAQAQATATNSAIVSSVIDLEHIRDNCKIANMPNEVRYIQAVIDRLNNLSVTSQ